MTETNTTSDNGAIEAMFKVGAHLGYSRARRHASVRPFLFGVKNGVDVIDLTQTTVMLDKALERLTELGKSGRKVLFVGTKPEIREKVKATAISLGAPYVTERWVGGILTNWPEIKKRVARLKELTDKFAKGELEKYTKKERLLFERERAKLEMEFGGIANLDGAPGALCVIDSREESIAVAEAKKMKVETIALLNSDCDKTAVTYSVLANDSALLSVEYFLGKFAEAYKTGLSQKA